MAKAKKQNEAERELTAHRVRELLSYDPESGEFRWRANRGPARIGRLAGSATIHGYTVICVDGLRHYSHRLAWLYKTGRWPELQIDHINGIGSDNRLSNLRQCTNAQNCQNLGRRRNNTSGLTGVHWNKERQRWVAQIRWDGKITPLGRYASKEEAHSAYLLAKRRAHNFQPTPRELQQ